MKLLFAEDDKDISKAVTTLLERNSYTVEPVYNGVDALDYATDGDYDAIVMDIMMPKMDGITVLKKIRSAGNTVPVLLLTAKSGIDDRVEGLDSGANDYLPKPFDTRELLARVRAMTRQQTIGADNQLRCGNVTLDRSSFEMEAPGGKVRLGNKEYQMMEMLMANPGQVLSVDRFMEKVWGYDSDTEMSVVWVNISYLRKKLTSLDADIQIKAVRNQGYSLEVKS